MVAACPEHNVDTVSTTSAFSSRCYWRCFSVSVVYSYNVIIVFIWTMFIILEYYCWRQSIHDVIDASMTSEGYLLTPSVTMLPTDVVYSIHLTLTHTHRSLSRLHIDQLRIYHNDMGKALLCPSNQKNNLLYRLVCLQLTLVHSNESKVKVVHISTANSPYVVVDGRSLHILKVSQICYENV